MARERDSESNNGGWLAIEPILDIHYDLVEEGKEYHMQYPHMQIFITDRYIRFRRVA